MGYECGGWERAYSGYWSRCRIPVPGMVVGMHRAILALSVCAMASGARSLYAIAQWGRMQDPATLRELGFTRERTPAVSTFHKVFTGMDVEAFEGALGEWIETQMGRDRRQ